MGSLFSSNNEPFVLALSQGYAEIWQLIIQEINDPNPKNIVVYLLWLMQANKFLEGVVRKYFEQKEIKPFSKIILRGQNRVRFESFTSAKSKPYEIRYGVITKKKIWDEGCGTMVYRFVYNRRIVSVKFMFDSSNNFRKVCFGNDDYEFQIEISALSSETQLSRDAVEVLQSNSYPVEDIQCEIQWCYGIVARWEKQAKIDLFA